MRFDFIQQMKAVTYPLFFHCEPLTKDERKRMKALPQLPQSYVEFLNTFGKASFFRELDRDEHHLRVFPPPREVRFRGDSYLVNAAATDWTVVAFKFSDLSTDRDPPLFDIVSGGPRRRADSFMDWLSRAWDRCRRRYTKKTWARVLAGPEPFSAEEQRIVEIRRGFSWRQLPPYHGKIAIEFTNTSGGYLSRYSIGVRDKYGASMIGGFLVDVARVGPGTTAVIHVPMGGYAHLLTAESSVLFDKGEPKPESRGDFGEFKPTTKS